MKFYETSEPEYMIATTAAPCVLMHADGEIEFNWPAIHKYLEAPHPDNETTFMLRAVHAAYLAGLAKSSALPTLRA